MDSVVETCLDTASIGAVGCEECNQTIECWYGIVSSRLDNCNSIVLKFKLWHHVLMYKYATLPALEN